MYKKELCQWCSLQYLPPAVKAIVMWTDSSNLEQKLSSNDSFVVLWLKNVLSRWFYVLLCLMHENRNPGGKETKNGLRHFCSPSTHCWLFSAKVLSMSTWERILCRSSWAVYWSMEFNHQLLAKGKRYSSKHTAILVQGKCSGLQIALTFHAEGVCWADVHVCRLLEQSVWDVAMG